jgi:hypothetical protein
MWTVVPDIYNAFTATHIQTSIFIWTNLRCYWRYLDNSMLVILLTWCQIQRTSSGLRYLNCGPGNIPCIYSSIYSVFNIHLNVSALLLEISRQFTARYTANSQPNGEHVLTFTLRELWSRLYTKYLQLRIFRLQYSAVCICAAIGEYLDNSLRVILQACSRYSAHSPVYVMWSVVPDIYNAFTAPHVQASIFSWTYMPCYWWYLDNSTLGMLQTWCQIQHTSVSLLYVNCGSGLIQCIYSFAYSGFNIRLNVSALLLEIIGHFHARYTANLEPNTAHILLFTLCELCSQPYTKSLQLDIFRLQYSAVGNCAVILDIATTQCALYCKLVAKYSAHPPVYNMWTVVPDIYNAFTAPHVQASIYIWTYLRCY